MTRTPEPKKDRTVSVGPHKFRVDKILSETDYRVRVKDGKVVEAVDEGAKKMPSPHNPIK
jgi:hypothetical protein